MGKKKRNALKEPSTYAGIAVILSAVFAAGQQVADAVAGSGGDLKAAIPAAVAAVMGLIAVILPEGKADAGA